MNRPPRSLSVLLALMVLGLGMAPTAVSAQPVDDEGGQSIRKLSRGLANALGGFLEIPLTIQAVGSVKGPVAGLSLGLVEGVGAAIARTLIGLAEVLTFPIPLPSMGYEPLLQPEFLLQPDSSAAAGTRAVPAGSR